MKHVGQGEIAATFRYEFRMQIRRRAVWITLLALSLLVVTGAKNPWSFPSETPLLQVVATWSEVVQLLLGVGYGVLLADRLPRDGQLGVREILVTLPGGDGRRLVGKYLGAAAATAVPMLLVYAIGIVYLLVDRGDAMAIPLGMAAFLLINVPGLLFVAAFSIACPAVLWVPLYDILFIGYWFWGNALSPTYGIPSLSGTLLTPVGGYIAAGLFGGEGVAVYEAGPAEAVLSIALLLGGAAVALYAVYRYLRRQAARP